MQNSTASRPLMSRLWFRLIIIVTVPVSIFSLLLVSQKVSVAVAFRSIYTSIFGSAYSFGEVIIRCTYLILTSMAALLPAKVGLANSGGEGQMIIAGTAVAALGSSVFASLPRAVGIPVLLLVGILAGMIWAAIAVFCKQFLNMNEVLCTLLLNYVATYVIYALLYGILRDPHGWNYPQTVLIPDSLRFNRILNTRANIGIVISIIIAIVIWIILNKTLIGFKMRAIGGNPTAAGVLGLKVKLVQSITFLFAGGCAGLAGAIMICGIEGRMRVDCGRNMGTMGFLVAGMAQNDPALCILSALLIGALDVAGNGVEMATGLPAASMQILIMLVLLVIMAVEGGNKK